MRYRTITTNILFALCLVLIAGAVGRRILWTHAGVASNLATKSYRTPYFKRWTMNGAGLAPGQNFDTKDLSGQDVTLDLQGASATTLIDASAVKNPDDRLGTLYSRRPNSTTNDNLATFPVDNKHRYYLVLAKGSVEVNFRVYEVAKSVVSTLGNDPNNFINLHGPLVTDPNGYSQYRDINIVASVNRVADPNFENGRVNDGVMEIPQTVAGQPSLCIDADGDGHASLAAYQSADSDHQEAMTEVCKVENKPIDDCNDNDKTKTTDCSPPPPPTQPVLFMTVPQQRLSVGSTMVLQVSGFYSDNSVKTLQPADYAQYQIQLQSASDYSRCPQPSANQAGTISWDAGSGTIRGVSPGIVTLIAEKDAGSPQACVHFTVIPLQRNTLLEYLEHGPDCTGHEQECPALYQKMFSSIGISPQEMTVLSPVISTATCTANEECQASACVYEFHAVRAQAGSTPGSVVPACGANSCGAGQVWADARDALPWFGSSVQLHWKSDTAPVVSTFSADLSTPTLSVGEGSLRSVKVTEQAVGSTTQTYTMDCPASSPSMCVPYAECNASCQDLDGDGVPANPSACTAQIQQGLMANAVDCDDNNPEVSQCTCNFPVSAKISVWARSSDTAAPVQVTAFSLGDILQGRITMVVDLNSDPGCLRHGNSLAGNGNEFYPIPQLQITPVLKARHGLERSLSQLFGVNTPPIPSFNIYNDGGKLSPLFGDGQQHSDFGPEPAGDADKITFTARRRFTATLDLSQGRDLVEQMIQQVTNTPLNPQLVQVLRTVTMGLATATPQERSAKIQKFLSMTLKQLIEGSLDLDPSVAGALTDNSLKDLTQLRMGFTLTDANGTAIPATLDQANSNSYPITTDRYNEPNPGIDDITNARTLGDILNLMGDKGDNTPLSAQITTFLSDPTLWELLGDTPDERRQNLQMIFAMVSNSKIRSKASGSMQFSKANTNVVMLPELLIAGCQPNDCSQLSSTIEKQLQASLGSLPTTTMVVVAKGVGSGVIKHQNQSLTLYFVDAKSPDWAALGRILQNTNLLRK